MKEIFKNILIPYNGCKGSQKAFKKAIKLAQLTQSKITVLTCVEGRSVFGFLVLATIMETRCIRQTMAPSEDPNISPLQGRWRILAVSGLLLLIVCSAVKTHSIFFFMLSCIAMLLALQLVLRKTELPMLGSPWSFLLLSIAVMGGHIIYWNYFSAFHHNLLIGFESLFIRVVGRLLPMFPSSVVGGHIVISGQPVDFSMFDVRFGVPVVFSFIILSEDHSAMKLIKALASLFGIVVLVFLKVLLVLHMDQQQLLFSDASQFLVLIGSYIITMAVWRSSSLSLNLKSGEIAVCVALSVCLFALPGLVGRASSSKIQSIGIDESHGRWETTQAQFDTANYGRDTVYNYALLRKRLESQYDVQVITEDIANIDTDLFIVKTPVEFYSQQEKEVIQEYVRDGGTLLVIGEHTNLFGHAMVTNDLLGWTGLRLNHDATLSYITPHYDFRARWWNRHPILYGIDNIEFQTSATISASSPHVFPFIVGDKAVAEEADYSNDRFFGELIPDSADRNPPLVLGAYQYIGDGKVILFGDSTIWSNFSFFAATNEALLGNLLRACEVKPGLVIRIVVLLLGLGCVIGVYWYCRSWTSAVLILLISLAFAFPWYGDSHYIVDRSESSPGPDIVVVDGVHSSAEFRADIRKGTKKDLFDYSTFYAWFSRVGISPRISRSNCYGVPRTPVIIINPDKSFSSYELEQIDTYLRTGGHILLLDDPLYAQSSSAGQLLTHFGISYVPEFSGSIHDPEGPALSENLLGLPFDIIYDKKMARGMPRTRASGATYCLSGTVALLVDEEGFVICGRKDIGQGSVIVFCRSSIFSEFVMGDVWGGKEPGESKSEIYELAYSLVNSWIGGE